jgi:hypothetical protein
MKKHAYQLVGRPSCILCLLLLVSLSSVAACFILETNSENAMYHAVFVN